jgi:hypothetical protein
MYTTANFSDAIQALKNLDGAVKILPRAMAVAKSEATQLETVRVAKLKSI